MTREEVIKILTEYNDWRRGNTDELKHSPTTIGVALEKAIELLQKQKEPDLICQTI